VKKAVSGSTEKFVSSIPRTSSSMLSSSGTFSSLSGRILSLEEKMTGAEVTVYGILSIQ